MESFLIAAALVTKIVDWIRNAFDEGTRAPKWIWNIAAFAVGIGVAYLGDLNLVPDDGDFGLIATGLALGASGSGFHELFDYLSSRAKAG